MMYMYSHLLSRGSISFVQLVDANNEDGQNGRQNHDPTQSVRPQWVQVVAVFGRFVLGEAKDQNPLKIKTIRLKIRGIHELMNKIRKLM